MERCLLRRLSLIFVCFLFAVNIYAKDWSSGVHPRVMSEIKRLQHPTRMKLMMRRFEKGMPYIGHIASRINARGLPIELMVLPVVESGYNVHAVSPKGAGGMWQIMIETARYKGLVINEWVDERFDFFKSTDAALDVVQENHMYFRDWLLTFAAYNCGPGKLKDAIRRAGTNDFWELLDKGVLPSETEHYVIQILALSALFSDYIAENAHHGQVVWEVIPTKKQLDVNSLALLCRSDTFDFFDAHAELKRGVIPPTGGYIKIPREFRDIVRSHIEAG